MVKLKAEQIGNYLYVPPRAISDNAYWRSAVFNGAFAARRGNCIILIICSHKGLSEEGMIWRKSCAASMRLSHSATFVFRFFSLSGPCWGSFGGMKTCSMTERKISASRLLGVGMDMTVEIRLLTQRQRVQDHVWSAWPGFNLMYRRTDKRRLPDYSSCEPRSERITLLTQPFTYINLNAAFRSDITAKI